MVRLATAVARAVVQLTVEHLLLLYGSMALRASNAVQCYETACIGASVLDFIDMTRGDAFLCLTESHRRRQW